MLMMIYLPYIFRYAADTLSPMPPSRLLLPPLPMPCRRRHVFFLRAIHDAFRHCHFSPYFTLILFISCLVFAISLSRRFSPFSMIRHVFFVTLLPPRQLDAMPLSITLSSLICYVITPPPFHAISAAFAPEFFAVFFAIYAELFRYADTRFDIFADAAYCRQLIGFIDTRYAAYLLALPPPIFFSLSPLSSDFRH